MGYVMQNGRYANTIPCPLFGPGALNAPTTNSNPVELGDRGTVRLNLAVAAVTGVAPTLDIAIQTRRDSADAWRTVGSFATASAVGVQRACFAGIDRFVRAVANVGGTALPSFTFTLDGEAV